MKSYLLLAISLISLQGYCQQSGVLEGSVYDSATRKPLDGASIELLKMKDSSRISASASSNGRFRFSGVPLSDSLIVRISYTGYETFNGLLMVRDKNFAMQRVYLKPEDKAMDAVVIKAPPRLVTIKKDTIEFNASNYKTQPNAVAEDVIRKIPGMIIDGEGRLFFNGRPVSKILVDGRALFGADGKIALSNVPVDLIRKIQVATDSLRIQGGQNADAELPQTLNIKLKEGNKYFGNLQTGYGSGKRYNISGLVNQSRGKERLSILGGANNINIAGILPPTGVSIAALTNGGGITRTAMSGVNYNTDWNGKQLNAFYQFTRPVTYLESLRQRRQNVLPDSLLNTSSSQQFENRSRQHDLQMSFDKKSFLFNLGASDRDIESYAANAITTGNEHVNLINALKGLDIIRGKERNGAFGLAWRKQLNRNDRFSLDLQGRMREQRSDDENSSTTVFYKNNQPDSQAILRQLIQEENQTKELTGTLSYSHNFNENFRAGITNGFNSNWSDADKTTWKRDSAGNKIGIDSSFSNAFRSLIINNLLSTRMSYHKKNMWVTASLGWRYNKIDNTGKTHASRTKNLGGNWISNIGMYVGDNAKKGNFNLALMMDTRNPTLEQLQPVVDNKNPLYLRIGNPDLRPTTNYGVHAGYRKLISLKTGSSVYGGFAFNPVTNKIILSSVYDSLGRQTSQYVNVDGTWTMDGNASYDFSFKKGEDRWKLAISSRMNRAHDLVYLNGRRSATDNFGFGPAVNLQYGQGTAIETSIGYYPSYTNLRYEQNRGANRHFWIHNINSTFNIYGLKRLKWQNSLAWNYNGSLPEGFDHSSLFWNAALSYLCLKNRKGEVRLTAFDILRQNRNTSRQMGDNYIEDSQANNLQRYFMLGFVWNFSGAKPLM